MTSLSQIEGIGPAYAARLAEAGLRTTENLLATGGTAQGRTTLAEQCGIAPELILRWVNHADLFRIKGIGGEWADLLEAGGVDTVLELAQRNATNLQAKLFEVNQHTRVVRQVPSETQVARWIEQAKTLERAVHHG